MSSRSRSADSCRAAVALSLAAAVGLAGCNAMIAQNPASPMRSVNAVYRIDTPRLMLQGVDVVAYFVQGQMKPGLPDQRADYEGVTYFFSDAANRAAFVRDPARFQPAYHGFDAMRMVYAIPEAAAPQHWRMVDGRLYLFADEVSKAAFELDLAGNIALADHYWKAEVLGSNSAWQRMARLVDRVPHYQSRDALAQKVADAKGKPG